MTEPRGAPRQGDPPRARGADQDPGGDAADPGVASPSSLEEEPHPERHPGSPGEVARMVTEEAAEGGGPLEGAKRALRAIDRDVSGEYERREDPSAPEVRESKRRAGEDAG